MSKKLDQSLKRLKVNLKVDIYIRHLHEHDQQRFTMRSGVLTGNDTIGGTAQVAAAHCPNIRTLDPTVCSYNRPTYAPASRTMAFTPQCSPATTKCTKVLLNLYILTDCTVGQFRCDSGQCTTVRSMCDGVTYCADGSDQANCCEYIGSLSK